MVAEAEQAKMHLQIEPVDSFRGQLTRITLKSLGMWVHVSVKSAKKLKSADPGNFSFR